MSGDALARGAKRASFMMPATAKNEPVELRNVAPEEPLVSHVDNSTLLFKKPSPAARYKGKPMGDRVLVKRVARESNSMLIIPDAAQAKSDMGMVVSVGDGLVDITTGKRTPVDVEVGELVLFDRFAAIGQEITLADENGESEHLILQAHDVLLRLFRVEAIQ
jgi:co-chaperonin GroES (HSP10)